MDEHQHKEHVHTVPGEADAPEVVDHPIKKALGGITQSDDINVGQVAMIGAFLALGLFVLVTFLQAWFYYVNDAEYQAKTAREYDPATPFGAMVVEHNEILATGDLMENGKIKHHGLPIQAAMKMVIENPKYLAQPLSAGSN